MHDSRAVTVATSGGSAASAPPKVGHRKWVLIIVIKVTAHVPHQQRVSKGRERRRAAFQLPCKGCGAAGACATLLLRTCLGCACVLRTRNCSSSGSNVAGLAMWGATLLSLLRAQGRELRQRFFSRSCSLTQLACLRGRPRALWGAVLVAGGAGAVGGGRLRVVQCNVGREGRPAALRCACVAGTACRQPRMLLLLLLHRVRVCMVRGVEHISVARGGALLLQLSCRR